LEYKSLNADGADLILVNPTCQGEGNTGVKSKMKGKEDEVQEEKGRK